MSCAALAILALPAAAFSSTLSFQKHTQDNASDFGGGAPFYQHADLNHDGREDLVFAYSPGQGAQNIFAVQLATADGVYGPATSYQINPNTGIEQLVLGDFNNDGAIDILIAAWDGHFYLYQNDKSGKFTLVNTFSFVGSSTSDYSVGIAAGDFNHDSITDLAFINAGRVNVWFGNGKNGFTTGPSTGVLGITPQIGDFDGDGKADLLLTDATDHTKAYVLYGDNTGHFPQTTTIYRTAPAGTPTDMTYVEFSVGDVNSDGKSDVMAVQRGAYKNRVFIYYGDSSRQLRSRTYVTTRQCVEGPATVADLDGNGYNDLIVREDDCTNTNYGPPYIDVLTRNPNSSYNADRTVFTAPPIGGVTYGVPFTPQAIRANADTKPDLLLTQCADSGCYASTINTLLNTSSGNFPSCEAPADAKGINVCKPSGSVASPVAFAIGAAGPVPMRDVEVWIDGKKLAEQIDGFSYYTFLNKNVSLTPGSHKVTVSAAGWDQSLVKKSFTVSVQ